MRALLDELRIDKEKTFKSWRHTFAFWAADHMAIHKLKEMLGHSSLRVTEIYCEADLEECAQDIRDRCDPTQSEEKHG